ncbi:MAG: lipid A biosynthesis acyltransferase [Pelagibacteraceae bacterium]|nr:lipid A biosynthesis acyltransferase [Pelagibacteraceae bacterium]PHX89037.1 MAG: lipid A biosynthesis acyltransferase [Pelagibacteraceae bacterium]
MKLIKYFIQFVFIIILFFLFKILRFKLSSFLGGKIFEIIGPIFRSEKLIHANIKRALPKINPEQLNYITQKMWNNYGRIFAEYMFVENFRNNKLNSNIVVNGQEILDEIKKQNKSVVFVSGHFSNFELMVMHIEKSGIKLCGIYRPLNNFFLNGLMEKIRKKYICKNPIKKGIWRLKEIINLQKKNYSTIVMIDQRLSEGVKSKFFNQDALTTTIPAQMVKKFKLEVVPIFIERFDNINFKITIHKPIKFLNEFSVKEITDELNIILEKMILQKPEQWIWSHNRWK